MPPRSLSRGRERTRSRTPRLDHSRSPSHPHRRSISPRQSRSPSYDRNGGRRASRGMSRSPSPEIRSTKIVVERLSKNINEDHLRELFEGFGEIVDMDMPMNRQTGTNRGTAYILYAVEADADQAIAHMHEAQLDGAVISVSIVIPRRKFSPSPPLARRGANLDQRARMDARGPPPTRRRSPARNYNRGVPSDTYRPRSLSRSRSPRARRSHSRTYSSRSRSPRRRGGRRDTGGRNDTRRRSSSYSSYSTDRSLSRSRAKSGRERR